MIGSVQTSGAHYDADDEHGRVKAIPPFNNLSTSLRTPRDDDDRLCPNESETEKVRHAILDAFRRITP